MRGISRLMKLFRRAVLSLLIALWFSPTLVFACDGDGAPGLIEHNRVTTQRFAVLAVALLMGTVFLYFKRHRKGLSVIIVSVALLVLHPVWVYGGGGGDCGRTMAERATWIAGFLAISLVYQLTLWMFQGRRAIDGRT